MVQSIIYFEIYVYSHFFSHTQRIHPYGVSGEVYFGTGGFIKNMHFNYIYYTQLQVRLFLSGMHQQQEKMEKENDAEGTMSLCNSV